MNIPNRITVSRMCFVPLVLFFFLADFIPYGKLVAAVLFGVAALTDIDGKIARKLNQVTDLGKFLDPIADKVLITTGLLLICSYPISGEGITQALPIVLPVWVGIVCVVIILSRELIISAFRQIAATKNLVLAADYTGKVKAVFQDVTVFLYMIFAFVVAEFYPTIQGVAYTVVNIVLLVLLIATTILTIISGLNYIIKNKQIFKTNDKQSKQMPYDLIIPSVLKSFFEEGVLSVNKIADRFNMNYNRAEKIIDDMAELGYVSDEGSEREILLTEEEFKQLFEE